jgi:hypothetical protein
MRWRIRRIVNGCAAQRLVARRDVISPEFISFVDGSDLSSIQCISTSLKSISLDKKQYCHLRNRFWKIA